MDSSLPGLFERSGSPFHEEGRDSKTHCKGALSNRRQPKRSSYRTRSRSIPEKEAEVSSQAKSKGRSRGLKNEKPTQKFIGCKVASEQIAQVINDRVNHKTFDSVCMKCRSCPCQCPSEDDPFEVQALKRTGIHRSPVDTLSFKKWCSFLAISVLRTRSSFSAFLHATLHLQRSTVTSSSPAFPLPVPFCGVFARMPPGLSSSKRNRCHFRRALHVVVMALN